LGLASLAIHTYRATITAMKARAPRTTETPAKLSPTRARGAGLARKTTSAARTRPIRLSPTIRPEASGTRPS
jgi:hypothetical protein